MCVCVRERERERKIYIYIYICNTVVIRQVGCGRGRGWRRSVCADLLAGPQSGRFDPRVCVSSPFQICTFSRARDDAPRGHGDIHTSWPARSRAARLLTREPPLEDSRTTLGAKSAVPLSKATILGGSIGNFVSLAWQKHPSKVRVRPMIDYEAAWRGSSAPFFEEKKKDSSEALRHVLTHAF